MPIDNLRLLWENRAAQIISERAAVVLHRPQTSDANRSQLLLKMCSHTLSVLGFAVVYFPWKAGTIAKTVLVSFNNVLLGADCGALLSLCAFLGYHSLYCQWKARNGIRRAQLSKITEFGCIHQMLLKNCAQLFMPSMYSKTPPKTVTNKCCCQLFCAGTDLTAAQLTPAMQSVFLHQQHSKCQPRIWKKILAHEGT